MRIERQKPLLSLIFFFAVLFLGFSQLRAATVEVEDDDEAVEATPTSDNAPGTVRVKGSAPVSGMKGTEAPRKAPDASASRKTDEEVLGRDADPEMAEAKGSADAARVEGGTGTKRAHISDNLSFYYFLRSGLVTSDPSQLPSIGKVITMDVISANYSTPKKTYVLLTPSAQKQVKVGDLFVISRAKQSVQEARSGFSGFLVKNLAVVKVLEVQQRKCLVQVLDSFEPFVAGDMVRLYEDEVGRWKQAQVKKSLPQHPVKCFVAGGENMEIRHFWTMSDYIILTAGSKKGLVEGQEFELRKYEDRGDKSESLHVPVGKAEAFYVGPNYSLARIQTSQVPVEAGFEAYYDPAGEK